MKCDKCGKEFSKAVWRIHVLVCDFKPSAKEPKQIYQKKATKPRTPTKRG